MAGARNVIKQPSVYNVYSFLECWKKFGSSDIYREIKNNVVIKT